MDKSLITNLKRKLPELCSVRDLMKLGIYRSEQAAYSARKSGNCPAYFRLPFRGIVYPRDGVIEFLMRLVENGKDGRIKNALISHSEVPVLRQNQKLVPR